MAGTFSRPMTTRLHICVDMQNLFADPSIWGISWLPRVLPKVARVVRHAPAQSLFTRFIPPHSAEACQGRAVGSVIGK